MITTTQTDDGYLYACDACGWAQTLPFSDWRNPKCGCGKSSTLYRGGGGGNAVRLDPAAERLIVRARSDCYYLIGPTDQSVEQLKCGCPGSKLTSVWECELHGLVSPFTKVELARSDVLPCHRCSDYRVES